MLKTTPAVFAVGRKYQIMTFFDEPCLYAVRIGDEIFYDAMGGVCRSEPLIHRVEVPMELLDAVKSYTVIERPIIERTPYHSKLGETVETTYAFRPVPTDRPVRAYMIADAHGQPEEPTKCANAFGDLDFLMLNGDLISACPSEQCMKDVYAITNGVAKGEIPIVYARGNHDLRGAGAEKIHQFTPTENGKTYYTFRLGTIWGLILDCGEDKYDNHPEYGGVNVCEPFRREETRFIKDVIARADEEYEAPGVSHRIVMVHIPFTHQIGEPFNIEPELYTEWAKLIRENIHPELMLCGHLHYQAFFDVGGKEDQLGHPCPVVICSARNDRVKPGLQYGTGFVFSETGTKVSFTDHDGTVSDSREYPLA